MAAISKWLGESPRDLRRSIQTDESLSMPLRRGVIVAPWIGIGSMFFTTMLQLGIVRRLPDPPIGRFDTKKVNSSNEPYSYDSPDSPVTITAHAINMVLASMGPLIAHGSIPAPLLASAAAAAQAGVAASCYQMPRSIRLTALLHR
jgi:hypothetical protein